MSGPTYEAPLGVAQRERAARSSDSGVDDGKVDAHRHVRERVAEHERTLEDALRGNPMGDVDDLRLRRDALDHAVARADEVVLQAEVGEEGNDHDGGTIRRTASDQAVEVV